MILTEGDSAKSLAVSGLGVIGRDRYGVFPLRGKILNVREASHKQVCIHLTGIHDISNILLKLNFQMQIKTHFLNTIIILNAFNVFIFYRLWKMRK